MKLPNATIYKYKLPTPLTQEPGVPFVITMPMEWEILHVGYDTGFSIQDRVIDKPVPCLWACVDLDENGEAYANYDQPFMLLMTGQPYNSDDWRWVGVYLYEHLVVHILFLDDGR